MSESPQCKSCYAIITAINNAYSTSGYENQCPIQIEILRSLSHLIRSGQYTGPIGVPDSIVLVGHSLGSALSAAAIAVEPSLAEGLILTGDLTVPQDMFILYSNYSRLELQWQQHGRIRQRCRLSYCS